MFEEAHFIMGTKPPSEEKDRLECFYCGQRFVPRNRNHTVTCGDFNCRMQGKREAARRNSANRPLRRTSVPNMQLSKLIAAHSEYHADAVWKNDGEPYRHADPKTVVVPTYTVKHMREILPADTTVSKDKNGYRIISLSADINNGAANKGDALGEALLSYTMK